MDQQFIVTMKELVGQTVKAVSMGETKDGRYMLFDLHIGNKRLCFEVNKISGRAFLMGEEAVDGAGVFPLDHK